MSLYKRMRKGALRRVKILRLLQPLVDYVYLEVVAPLVLRKIAKKRNGSRPVIIFIGRRMLAKDLAEIKSRGKEFQFIEMPPKLWSGPQYLFTPKEVRIQTYYKERADRINYNWEKNIRWAKRVLEAIGGREVKAVVNSNFDYWQDHAFHVVCKNRGIPFLVLMRENRVSRFGQSEFSKRNAGFVADVAGIAVASKIQKDLLTQNAIMAGEDVWVTGYPRHDTAYEDLRRASGARRNIGLFLGHDSLRYGLASIGLYEDCLRSFVGVLLEGDLVSEIVVKTKDGDSAARHLRVISKYFGKELACGKVRISTKDNVGRLVRKSRLTVGGNSMSTVEALLSPAPVIFPKYIVAENTGHNIFSNYVSSDEALVRFSDSPLRFESDVRDLVSADVSEVDSVELVSLRSKYFGESVCFSTEESASDRFLGMLAHYVS